MKNIIYIIIILSASLPLVSQQDVILTKYSRNPLFFNPAYAGSKGAGNMQITANYRDQWLGLEGSPKTMMVGANANLFDDKVGLGISAASESIGVDSRLDLQTNYAYRILLEDAYIVGGLRLGLHRFSSTLSDIRYSDLEDNVYDRGNFNANAISVGLGTYYYTKQFFVGLSVPTLRSFGSELTPERSPHFYLHTGAVFYAEESDMQLETTILLKYEQSAPLQFTWGANLWLIKGFAIGTHYRSSDAFGVSTEFLLGEFINLGASYDLPLSDLRTETTGSLELSLDYIFNFKRKEIPMSRRKGF